MTLSASDFELLLQSNRILSSKLDTGEVLQSVLELATKVVRAEASSLLLLDEATNELYFNVALGSAKESVKQIRLKVGEGIAGWVAKERKPLIVNDVSKDSRFTGKVDKSTSFVTRSVLAVPLVAKGRVLGVVEAINKESNGVFSEQDEEAFEIFSSQAAIALENARLFSEILKEKEKLNTVFAQMSDGVLLLDKNAQILLMNDAATPFIGIPSKEVFGKSFDLKLFPNFESSPSINEILSFKEKLTPVELIRRQGKDYFISALVLRIGGGSSSNEGYLVILHDTTEEKRGERLKRNFLSLISHKLKTPLTVILGYAPALMSKTDNLTDFQKTALKAVCEKGEQLGNLVDKLLRFTIVESETLKPNIEKKSVRDVLEEAISALDTIREESKAELNIDSSVSSGLQFAVDGPLAVEVFKNLIENAIKFNDKSPKTVRVSAEERSGQIFLRVKDNGVGIPIEEKEKLFQKFYQIENSFTGQVPGAGLGLALCKKVVEAMNGKIEIASQLGEGTQVTVVLPSEPA